MSCNCSSGSSYDGGIYEGVCNADIPYPSVSHESVPSLIDNLVYALYGVIEKDVTSGKVVWNIPCDPSNIPATINGIPRNDGEGLLCYIVRALNLTLGFGTAINIASGVAGAVPYQTAPSTTGFTAAGTSGQVLRSNGTSAPTWTTNIAGNAGTATQLQTSRTLGISGDVTGTASFDGSANATIAGTIANNAVTSAKLGSNERLQLSKAWVNFNGTTAFPTTIRSSYNVSSITKNGTGDYTVNFATALADANYSAVVMAQGATTASLVAPVAYAGTLAGGFVTPSTASVRFSTWSAILSGQADSAIINFQVFGN
jgi:hypothetical protein